jgi:hypothetical protein
MIAWLRLIVLTAAVIVAACFVLKPGQPGLSEPRFDWVSVADFLQVNEKQQKRKAELDRRLHALLERIRIKDEAIADLIAGRTTLLRVAAQFRRLQETSGEPDPVHLVLLGTPAERACRQVLAQVEVEMEDAPTPQKTAVLERLTKEFHFHVNQPGGVQLPGW